MIAEKEAKAGRYYTTDGRDMWKVEAVETVTKVSLVSFELGERVSVLVGDGECEKFVAVPMPGRFERCKIAKPGPGRSPEPLSATCTKKPGRRKSKSGYRYVTEKKGNKRSMFIARIGGGGGKKKNKHLGTFAQVELAAAAVEQYLGNKDEAIRLRKLAASKAHEISALEAAAEKVRVETDERIERLKGPVAYECAGCGADYNHEPERCAKCGGYSFSTHKPAAAAAYGARHGANSK